MAVRDTVARVGCLVSILTFLGGGHAQAQPRLQLTDRPAWTAGVAGADEAVDPPTVFRSGVDLVSLSVVVTGPRDQFIAGLTAENFAVYEDGVQQDVSFFAATDVPLDLSILLDTSASMTDKMQTVHQAAIGFASSVRPGDRIAIVDIKDGVRTLHGLSEDPAGAPAAIRQTTARGGTALYNGLYLTLKEMVTQRRADDGMRREAIVVLSDGIDTSSLVGFEDVMAVAKESGIAVYTITLKPSALIQEAHSNGRQRYSESDFSMRQIAEETGARAFFPTAITELAGVYGLIAEELATQYALGYTPKNPARDGSYRRVIVRVDEAGARTRARSGYVAAHAW
jgi:VWFA-related protein